ncbi:MAG: class I SAM-dependent methyltransferase [Kiritimatiellia bacterium]|jgi:SAM-dependent methyltransferase|nr:class I SAM-dependent methyltransferase [Kiritimatiellia bacterium]
MRVLTCYNCGSDGRAFYAEENGFSLVRCSACGLLYVEERPDDKEIAEAHKQGKHSGLKELNMTGRFNAAKISRYLKVLEDMFEGGLGTKATWLDVGCGHGEFIAAVKEYGSGRIAVRGTEPNIHKQESARKRGLDVSYFDIESHKEKYDAVSLLNVYSHLPDPPAFLELLKKRLNPEGEIIIETGDTACFPAKQHYRPFYLPDHFSFASESIVVDMLRRLGFEIIIVNKYPSLPFDFRNIAKEVVKAFLPRYRSSLRYYAKWWRYTQTDMFIRAKVKASSCCTSAM